ncbi:sensor histidine kinase [Ralstonia sp. RL]|uniref:sensor histidine kinase n=1 Tax=Ralstonia sp. RL TaxID=1839756 RepID=UPI000A947E71|nr:sensor histidine kinase [Ralstonia sp. RL]
MKPPRWALFNCNRVALAFAFALQILLGLYSVIALAENRQKVVEIQQAEFIISDASSIPPDNAGWQTTSLPHRAPKPIDRDLVGYWYKATFTPANTRQPLWLYFPKLRSGGTIYLNGVQIGEIRGADQLYQVRWFRPHLFFVPALSLHDGANEIAVRFAIREPLTSFGEFEIGPEKPLRESYDRHLFWENTSTEIATVICLLSGAFILVFWLRRRQEALYGIFGVCVLFWGLRTFIFRIPEVPMEYWVPWRFLYYFTTSGFIVSITTFLLKYSESKRPRLNQLLIVYWLGGCVLFLLIGAPIRRALDSYWMLGFLPFTVYAVIRLVIFTARQRTRSCIAMVLAIVFALALSLHDYAVQLGMFHLQEYYLLHLGIPAFLLVMACVLLERFITSLKQADSIHEQLALRVADREKELAASYEQLRKLERHHAATEERQRIMQDMHDGVGSQLLSTLVMVQRGAATQNDMVALLQECLDDMRLAIDSLSPEDSDLLPALGNFRFRMESRFRSMGLNLNWRSCNMPDTFEIAPHAGLQILRILQEALTNVLKHAQAKNVEVTLSFSSDALRVQVIDDGIGFVNTGKQSGRGLKNMRARAEKIGASFDIEHLSTGTAIRLDLSLSCPSAPALAA